MTDLVFYGGLNGMALGNQQFTMRNLTFHNSVTAINQNWDWSWTYKGVSIYNCSVGLNMSSGGVAAQSVGSITLIDSVIHDTPIGIITAHNSSSLPTTGGSLILENVQVNPSIITMHNDTGRNTDVPVARQCPYRHSRSLWYCSRGLHRFTHHRGLGRGTRLHAVRSY